MREAIYNLVQRRGTWPLVALLFILFVLGTQGFEYRRKVLGYETRTLDGRLWYSPVEARDFLETIGERGRRVYAATELTLDILFPIVYGTLFAILLIRVYALPTAKNLVLIPWSLHQRTCWKTSRLHIWQYSSMVNLHHWPEWQPFLPLRNRYCCFSHSYSYFSALWRPYGARLDVSGLRSI